MSRAPAEERNSGAKLDKTDRAPESRWRPWRRTCADGMSLQVPGLRPTALWPRIYRRPQASAQPQGTSLKKPEDFARLLTTDVVPGLGMLATPNCYLCSSAQRTVPAVGCARTTWRTAVGQRGAANGGSHGPVGRDGWRGGRQDSRAGPQIGESRENQRRLALDWSAAVAVASRQYATQ